MPLLKRKKQLLQHGFLPLIVTIAVIGIVVVLALKQLRLKVVKFIKGIVEGCLTIVKLKQKGAYLSILYMDSLYS